MITSTNSRKRAILLPLGLLMLSLAVFGWGLQYKLSLYDQGQKSVTHAAPEAKLLSQKERPVAAQAAFRLSEPPVWPLVLMIVLAFASCEEARSYFLAQRHHLIPPRLPASSQSTSVRPPPSLAFSL